MRPADSVDGHALHAVHAALVLQGRVGALAAHLEDDLLVAAVVVLAGAEDLDLEALRLGVAREHAGQIAGEQGGLVAARAGADLDDHVLGVVGVAGEHAAADLLAELVEQPAAVAELLLRELAQLIVAVAVAVAGEDLLGAGDVPLGLAIALHQLVRLGELGVAARRLGVARPVAEHVGVGELRG